MLKHRAGTHHECHEAAVAPAPPLLLVPGPHDLHAADGPKAAKLTGQVSLVHLRAAAQAKYN